MHSRRATGSSFAVSVRSRSARGRHGSAAIRARALRFGSDKKFLPFFKTGKELRERINRP